MLGQRRVRWTNVDSILGQYHAFAGLLVNFKVCLQMLQRTVYSNAPLGNMNTSLKSN